MLKSLELLISINIFRLTIAEDFFGINSCTFSGMNRLLNLYLILRYILVMNILSDILAVMKLVANSNLAEINFPI
jgi:hypothetical protein